MPKKDSEIVILDVNGRVRIPAEIREKFNWDKGQAFRVIVSEQRKVICLVPVKKIKAIDEEGNETDLLEG